MDIITIWDCPDPECPVKDVAFHEGSYDPVPQCWHDVNTKLDMVPSHFMPHRIEYRTISLT